MAYATHQSSARLVLLLDTLAIPHCLSSSSSSNSKSDPSLELTDPVASNLYCSMEGDRETRKEDALPSFYFVSSSFIYALLPACLLGDPRLETSVGRMDGDKRKYHSNRLAS